MTSHTRKWKEKQIEEMKKMLDESKVIALASIERFPASLLQELKKKLAGKAKIRVSKTRIIARALAESKYRNLDLSNYFKGPIALITANIDPFELYLTIKKNKANTYIRAGTIAEQDIIVPAGDTGLPPGPDLSILKAAGIPAIMKGSSIQVPKDTVVVHKGEVVSQEVASALSKLDIKPAELILKVLMASDGTTIYDASVLDIDTEKFENDIIACYRKAFNLAFNIVYITPENIELLLQKAFREAKQVATEAEFINSVTLPEFIAKAYSSAKTLSSVIKLDTQKADSEQKAQSKAAEQQADEKAAEQTVSKETEQQAEEEQKSESADNTKDEQAQATREEQQAQESKEEHHEQEQKTQSESEEQKE
ncbi:MAG: 50S ribosomal protein L10 [Candidatus Diapherotrites archaeon]|nr:50S ribosomal protein L10 [Candidatus Diapherotrites archaeon]